MDMSEINDLFLGECREGLDAMEAGLLDLGQGAIDAETINRIFRAAHSIKGGGLTFGFTELSDFAHVLETVLDEIRGGVRAIVPHDVQLLLDATDCLREMVTAACGSGAANPARVAEVHDRLVGALSVTMSQHADENAPRRRGPHGVAHTAPTAVDIQAPAKARTNIDSIRVSTDKIDKLINLVGELIITQSGLGRFQGGFNPGAVSEFNAGLAQLERNTRELQENVLAVRMLPVNMLFSRFPRLVRDLSRQLGKQVELVLSGAFTEIDKTILERLSDPLVHLVRNAIDHGIESPAQRRQAGKPETAVVEMKASHLGGNVVIEVIDDGAGLNHDKIRQRAISAGLIAPHEQLGEREINDLIFRPGFSTADSITNVSGRGVGLDIVKQNLMALGGSIEVHSTAGTGSRIVISLPLTLAILDGQLIDVADAIYIIPLTAIVESVEIEPQRLRRLSGSTEFYRLRDEFLPVIRLRQAFGLPTQTAGVNRNMLVVVESDARRYALLVDSIREQRQIVVKNLEVNYKDIPGLSGATILGDGTVALILDIRGLVRKVPAAPISPRPQLAVVAA